MIRPEEKVRQRLLAEMLEVLGFPKGLVVVEKSLSAFHPKAPLRRMDVVVLYRKESELLPLLLIECKSGPILESAKNQLFGYNAWIGAPFVSLANEAGASVYWREQGSIASVPFLPPYEQLVSQICMLSKP